MTFSTAASDTDDSNENFVKTNVQFKKINLNIICAYSITAYPAILHVKVTKFPASDQTGGCYVKTGFKRREGHPLRCFFKAAAGVK